MTLDWKYFKQILRIFFGVCLMLVGVVVMFYNLFMLATGFDAGLALLGLLIFLGGLLLTIYSVSALPGDRQA